MVVKMLTLPTIIGIIWVIISFICLLALPFVILIYMIKRKEKWYKIIFIQIFVWILIFTFIYFVFGSFWFFFGIIGPGLTMS
ncbi:MAG: hypothetical protein B6U78_02840 [Candidatus Aenigmarchaeota archaeon ex4484_224]|nr:MAG: hypothetical protein B6U78_02840 [Candidatus Aenigmarchaeota archaeon ex4484_224]